MELSVHSKVQEIYQNEQGRAVLDKYMPKLTRTPSFQMTYAMSFQALCRCHQWKLTGERLAQAVAELEAIQR